MINFPFISLPEHFTKLLKSDIQNTFSGNTKLELYINEHKSMNVFVRKIFKDIDADGFIGKIISVSGWSGIRNRLAAVYIEYAITGEFPEIANLALVTDIINMENKLRHFTLSGFSRAFLIGFYAKMTLIHTRKIATDENLHLGLGPLIIRDEHIAFMKHSKAKSIRIDWVIFQLVQFDYFLGTERMNVLLLSGASYESFFGLLSDEEQVQVLENCMTYGASINDSEIFLSDVLN